MSAPRLEIDLGKIRSNCRKLVESLGEKGISVAGVTKASLGSPEIARAMLAGGVSSIADSRVENIRRMRAAGLRSTFILLRSPSPGGVKEAVACADISFNSELCVVEALSEAARAAGKVHGVVLMVDLGDGREGMLPEDLERFVAQTNILSGINVAGIGTNLACFGGVAPDRSNMSRLSGLVDSVERRFDRRMELVSGGNSANLLWAADSDAGRINHLRLGEAILLGRETLRRSPVPGLETDAAVLIAEVIESKRKPSFPSGTVMQNAFGEKTFWKDRGPINRALLALGRQDVPPGGLTPLRPDLEVLGASSDHVVMAASAEPLRVGEEVRFAVDYGALLAAMTSPFVEKAYSGAPEPVPLKS
jgi:predicted amino acid racemase